MADMTIFPTGLTYSRNTKAPLESNRLFDTFALAQAYVNDADQNAYVGLTISVTKDEVAANNGLYYIARIADSENATGLLVKVGSDSSADVANISAKVTTLEGVVGSSESGLVADVAKNTQDIAANTAAISGKANAFTVGNGLSYSNNLLNVVVSTAAGNSLSVDENGLYVSVPEVTVPEFSLESVTNPNSSYASQYEFKKDGIVLNTINIPKDQFLKSANYDTAKKQLVFVFNTASGESTNEVDVSDLVDTYTAGSYITITENSVSVDYDSLKTKINEDLVAPVVTTVSGIDTRLQSAEGKVSTLETTSTDHETRISSLETSSTDYASRIGALEAVTHPTLDQVTTLENNYNTLNGTVSGLVTTVESIKVKDVDTTASNGVSLSLDNSGKIGVNVDINTIADAVIAKHVVEFDAESIKTTSAIGPNESGASVQTVLANLDSRISAAVSGGVTSVAAGVGVAVDSTDPNNPKVSIKIVDGSALRATADGVDLVWTEI